MQRQTAAEIGETLAEDQAAAFAYDVLHNRIFAEPVLLGAYPDLEAFGLPQ